MKPSMSSSLPLLHWVWPRGIFVAASTPTTEPSYPDPEAPVLLPAAPVAPLAPEPAEPGEPEPAEPVPPSFDRAGVELPQPVAAAVTSSAPVRKRGRKDD